MKPKSIGIILLALAGLAALAYMVNWLVSRNESRNQAQAQYGGIISPDSKCQCYCSDKCGPRDIKHGIDRPFVDVETGLCFCADRDKVNYIPNGCIPKSFSNSCCG